MLYKFSLFFQKFYTSLQTDCMPAYRINQYMFLFIIFLAAILGRTCYADIFKENKKISGQITTLWYDLSRFKTPPTFLECPCSVLLQGHSIFCKYLPFLRTE